MYKFVYFLLYFYSYFGGSALRTSLITSRLIIMNKHLSDTWHLLCNIKTKNFPTV